MAALKKVYQENKSVPVIVFEIDRGAKTVGDDAFDNVRCVAKTFADKECCNCIIVLSESGTVVQFSNDITREKYIFVDEMTVSEATKLLQVFEQFIPEEEMKEKNFNKIGTNPGALKRLAAECKSVSVDKFVEEWLVEATNSLSLFPFPTILKALKDLKNPDDGVSTENFKGIKEDNVVLSDAKEVGKATKILGKQNVILYRRDTKKYHMLSTPHKTALERFTLPRTWFEILTGK